MKKINVVVLTLVISTFLIISTFSGISAYGNSADPPGNVELIKEVYDVDTSTWVNETDAESGDTVSFRITVTYENVSANPHHLENIFIRDTLPECLEYVESSASPFEPELSSAVKILVWDLEDTKLYDGDSYVITFDANVSDCCCGEQINQASVIGDEYCTGSILEDDDTAIVNVPCMNPDIEVEKKVWDSYDECWVEEAYALHDTTTRFNITVHNTGDCTLEDIVVNDTIPNGLGYANNAIPAEDDISGNFIIWNIAELDPDEKYYIEFDATVVDIFAGNEHENWVKVTGTCDGCCPGEVTDEDSAIVKVAGMTVEKEVWDKDISAWMEETDASVGETVRFRIIISYYGDYTLYNIHVVDKLPECLEYANNAVPEEPDDISPDGKTLTWDLGLALHDEGSTTIEFDADVNENNCEDCINMAIVTANECSGAVLDWIDNATVHVICGLDADSGGPYYADVGETITISGSATGGTPPYEFSWDLDNDDVYGEDDEPDEPIVSTFTKSWGSPGTYIIKLKVTDGTTEDIDDTTVTVGGNNAPEKPNPPTGPSRLKIGVVYTFTAETTDPDGDQISYKFRWGDGTENDWSGFVDSGEEYSATHEWASMSTFNIQVKAKDIHGAESEWSNPLSVTVPHESTPIIVILLQKLIELFPILGPILQPIIDQFM